MTKVHVGAGWCIVPGFSVSLALQDGEVLEEELHTLAGLLDYGTVHTCYSRLHI